MAKKEIWGKALVPLAAVACLSGYLSPGLALFLGIVLALCVGNPYQAFTRPRVSLLLGLTIVGLGAGMDLHVVAAAGLNGIGYTLVGISATLALGTLLGRLLGTNPPTALLITTGTAICGGSAIAAVSAALKSKQEDISVALATVFCLNAAALYLFPWIGHTVGMSPSQFGLWSALAIHDTSSVVGAAMRFSPDSVPIATTVKLARALWIAPLAFALSVFQREPGRGVNWSRLRPPWFIGGFVIAAAIVTWIPALVPAGHVASQIAGRLLVLTLFLIGSHLTRAFLKNVGARPFLLGILLWACVSTVTFTALRAGWIHGW
jgi:uncharacterized integral membrane protein (TIGR00698 family)